MWINEIHWNGLISIPRSIDQKFTKHSSSVYFTVVKSEYCMHCVRVEKQKRWVIAFENAKILMTMWWIENSLKVVFFHFITIGVHWRESLTEIAFHDFAFSKGTSNVNTVLNFVAKPELSPNLYQLCQFNFMRNSFIWPTKLTLDHEINASDIK